MTTKKAPQTFHLLSVARSLEYQNEKVGFFLADFDTIATHAPKMSEAKLREEIEKLRKRGAEARKVLWPDEDGED